MSYGYYRDPQNGYVHEDEVEATVAEYDRALATAIEDYHEAAEAQALAEDTVRAIALVLDAYAQRAGDSTPPVILEALALVDAFDNEDKPTIHATIQEFWNGTRGDK